MKILKYPHPALTDKDFCKPVTVFDEALKKQLDDMWQTMLDGKGVGLAANQVGLPIRAFVMAYKPADSDKVIRLDVVNPVIEPDPVEGLQFLNEGCLSLPNEFLQVGRYKTIKLKFNDATGQSQELWLDHIHSICAQHELDHLDGIFFLEKVSRNIRRAVLRGLGLK